MNAGDRFEELLRSQPLRGAPADWKAEILDASETVVPGGSGWRAWLWPSPVAWAALAAGWMLAVGLNLSAGAPSSAAGAPSPALLGERLRILNELADTRPPAPPTPGAGGHTRLNVRNSGGSSC